MKKDLKKICMDYAKAHDDDYRVAAFQEGFDACFEAMNKTHIPKADVDELLKACDNMVALINVDYKEVNKSADRIELEFCDALTNYRSKHGGT